MKFKSIAALSLLACASIAFAGKPVAAPKAVKADDESRCVANIVKLKAALETEGDQALLGYVNLIPAYQEQLEMEVSDPYRCSAASFKSSAPVRKV